MKHVHDDNNGLTGRVFDDHRHKDSRILNSERRHYEAVQQATAEHARELARNMRITPR